MHILASPAYCNNSYWILKSKDCYSGRILLDSCINATAGSMLIPSPPRMASPTLFRGTMFWGAVFVLGMDDELSEIVPTRTLESVPDWMVLGILVPLFPSLRVKTPQKSFQVLHKVTIGEINALKFIQTLLPRIILSLLRGQVPSYTSYREWFPSWLPDSWDYHTVAQKPCF
jgi:hypothetical protein